MTIAGLPLSYGSKNCQRKHLQTQIALCETMLIGGNIYKQAIKEKQYTGRHDRKKKVNGKKKHNFCKYCWARFYDNYIPKIQFYFERNCIEKAAYAQCIMNSIEFPQFLFVRL